MAPEALVARGILSATREDVVCTVAGGICRSWAMSGNSVRNLPHLPIFEDSVPDSRQSAARWLQSRELIELAFSEETVVCTPVSSGLVVAVTGGEYSGKTTLLSELAGCGFPVVYEAAEAVLNIVVPALGGDEVSEWIRNSPEEFQAVVAYEQQRMSLAEGCTWTFLDRSMIDVLAFSDGRGHDVPLLARLLVGTRPIDGALVCETLTPFASRPSTGRVTRSSAESHRAMVSCEDAYRRKGIPTQRLEATLSPAQRAMQSIAWVAGLGRRS